MKIVIIGAGAMGGLFAARLAAAGEDVSVVDVWAEHIEMIRTQGLILETEQGEVRANLAAVTRAEDLAACAGGVGNCWAKARVGRRRCDRNSDRNSEKTNDNVGERNLCMGIGFPGVRGDGNYIKRSPGLSPESVLVNGHKNEACRGRGRRSSEEDTPYLIGRPKQHYHLYETVQIVEPIELKTGCARW